VPERHLPSSRRRLRRRPGSDKLHAEDREVNRKDPQASPATSPARKRTHGFSRGVRCALGVSVLLLGAAACGPDARSVGDSCPDLPLYRFIHDDKTDTWRRVTLTDVDGGEPLGADDLAKIRAAEAHCVTPAGTATGGTNANAPD